MKPICAKCGKDLIFEKSGVTVKIGLHSGYFSADLYTCGTCGYSILTGFGSEIIRPKAHHIDYDFSGQNI